MTAKEEEEDSRNINIPDAKGYHEVEGPQIENLNISAPLKRKQVNIGIEKEPKFAKNGYYWNNTTVDKVVELLHKYQDLFPTMFSYLKGIIGKAC